MSQCIQHDSLNLIPGTAKVDAERREAISTETMKRMKELSHLAKTHCQWHLAWILEENRKTIEKPSPKLGQNRSLEDFVVAQLLDSN